MIGIDMTYISLKQLQDGKLTEGINIFLEDILRGFELIGKTQHFELIGYSQQVQYIKKMFPQYEVIEVSSLPLKFLTFLTNGRKSGVNIMKKGGIYKKIVDNRHYSCVWFPFSTAGTVVELNTPSVYTVHDLIECIDGTLEKEVLSIHLNKSVAVITISDYVKNDLLSRFDNVKTEVSVIPNSIDLLLNKVEKIEELLDKKYILDINAYQVRKNAITLLKSFHKISNKIDVDLVFCGGFKDDDYFRDLENMIEELNLRNRVHLYFSVSFEKRNWLLKNASLFVTPSTNEGFGRTPIEAAMCQIPVISTKCTSLYEVTKGLLNYVNDPFDIDEYADLIIKLLGNINNDEELKKIATVLKEEYSLANTAKKYWNIFKKVEMN